MVGGQWHGADVLVTLSKPLPHEMLYQIQVAVGTSKVGLVQRCHHLGAFSTSVSQRETVNSQNEESYKTKFAAKTELNRNRPVRPAALVYLFRSYLFRSSSHKWRGGLSFTLQW